MSFSFVHLVDAGWVPVVISILFGCGAHDDAGVARSDSTGTAVPAGMETVIIEEAGISFEIDSVWDRIEPDWVWSREDTLSGTIGIRWMDIEPPMEPEPALLPGNSRILESDTVDLEWGFARGFTMEIFGEVEPGDDAQAPVIALEYHVLVQVTLNGIRRAYDFYASHPEHTRLEVMIPVIHEILYSVKLIVPETDPIEKETR